MTVVAEKQVLIGELYFELRLWLNEFQFYKDEVKIFNHRLEDIVKSNTGIEVMKEVEHFQNQYIRQMEVIDELRHDIKQHENVIEKESIDHPVAFDHRYFEDHSDLRDQVDQFKKIYFDLRKDFMRFLSKRM